MAGGKKATQNDKKPKVEKPNDAPAEVEQQMPAIEPPVNEVSNLNINNLNMNNDSKISTEIIDQILAENRSKQIPEISLIYDILFQPFPKTLHQYFQTLESKREKFENTIGDLADVNQANKNWDTVAEKICKLYVMATDIGLTAWGASNSENSAARFSADKGLDWELRHLQDLTFRILSKTAGLDWKGLQNNQHALHTLRSDVSKLSRDLPRIIDMEFREKMGNSIEGFSDKWVKLQEDFDHIQTSLKDVIKKQVRTNSKKFKQYSVFNTNF